eukprot:s586_g2.t1
MLYPMYTLPLQILMDMTRVSPHEELRDAGFVVEFDQSMGRALFVSHQWLGWSHPDPKGLQIQVLKEACANILSGKSRISAPVGEEMGELEQGHPKKDSKTTFTERRLFLWYDYFCCPQKSMAADAKLAIDSIATYSSRCELFVILCPEMEHADRALGTDLSTWAERGWCRMERMARELSSGNSNMRLGSQTAAFFPPGEGRFSSQGDRVKVAAVLKQLFAAKLFECLAKEQGPNQQQMRFDTKDSEEKFGEDEKEAAVLARFLHENSFTDATDPGQLNGDPLLVSALLLARADANDRITKGRPENCDVMKLLLSARAAVNDSDCRGATALHWAMISNTAQGVRILCEAGATH